MMYRFLSTLIHSRSFKMTIVSFCILVVLIIGIIKSQLCFAVVMNGEAIGIAKNRVEAEEIVEQTEEKLSKILGYTCSLKEQLQVNVELGGRADTAVDIESGILENMKGISRGYVLLVDGQPVIATLENGILDKILDDILATYVTKNTQEVFFVRNVEIVYDYVNNELFADASQIQEQLSPNGDGTHKLQVETIEKTTYTEDIQYTTQYKNDSTLYEGKTQIIQSGQSGQQEVTKTTNYVNGRAIDNQILQVDIIQQPVTEIVAVGTRTYPSTLSYGTYIWPVDGGMITSYFGYREIEIGSSNHKGLDIAGSYRQEIYAADGGVVICVDRDEEGYGNYIQIRHDNGDVTCYAHCDSIVAKEGECVAQGQVIAYMGETGVATGVHVHFEIIVDDVQVDPLNFLP